MKSKKLLSIYNTKGFFVIKKVFTKKLLDRAIYDCENIRDAIIYYDRKNQIRRIEKLFNKTKNLRFIHNKIKNTLQRIFKNKYYIFKDKFNAKPPGGEGFYAHYDGVFNFYSNKKKKRGWYEYSDIFVNCLVALDRCDSKNGTIEIAKADNLDFDKLLKNTKKNGSPDLKASYEKKIKFKKIHMNVGDICIFSNTYPHRSKKNLSKLKRRTLYYTYNPKTFGNNYLRYFKDKKYSKSQKKSLTGDL